MNDHEKYVAHLLQQFLAHFDFTRAVWDPNDFELTLYNDANGPFSYREFEPGSLIRFILINIWEELSNNCFDELIEVKHERIYD